MSGLQVGDIKNCEFREYKIYSQPPKKARCLVKYFQNQTGLPYKQRKQHFGMRLSRHCHKKTHVQQVHDNLIPKSDYKFQTWSDLKLTFGDSG